MKKNKVAFLFLLTSMALLFVNLIIIAIFSNIHVKSDFYSALNVSSLIIAFVSFIASSFFSFTVYIQTRNQNKINESLPKKDDQYIISNYSLFNIENEISFFSMTDDERDNILKTNSFLSGIDACKDTCNDVTRLVFLPTDSVNMPTYKVMVKSLEFISSKNKSMYFVKSESSVDGAYSANILSRGYNCFCVDVLGGVDKMRTLFAESRYIKLNLDIISVFNVKMNISFYVYPDSEKNTDQNPDKEQIPDLTTYTVHHTNYQIEDKSILES